MKPRSACSALVFLYSALGPKLGVAADSTPAESSAPAASSTTAPEQAAANAAGGASAGSSALVATADTIPGPNAALADESEALELPSSDSFSNDTSAETEQQHRLDLYGFADLTYTRLLIPEENPWNRIYFPTNSFAVGNFNLYLSANLGARWRALGEVRFMYLPNGATTTDNESGAIKRTDTTVLDYAGFQEPIHWGGIRIERVWVEHEFSTLFKLQVGAFLTPYGIWNVDHGSPVIVGIRAPIAVVSELFPAHQTGLQLYGSTFLDPFEVGYHLTLSNGRGPVEYQDFDDDKAVGGRLYLKTEAVGSLTVGASAYRGGYYDRSAKYVIQANGTVDQEYTTQSKYQEFSLGADLKWQWKRWLVQSEFIMNEATFEEGGRPRVDALKPPQGFQPDYRRWGAYGLVGYRTQILQTMPYVIVQYMYAPNTPVAPPALGAQLGLNIRPTPAVVLKLELTLTHFTGPGSIGLGNSPLRLLATQVAWAF